MIDDDPAVYRAKADAAKARVIEALAAQTVDEAKVVQWLCGLDVSTMDAISAMVERRVDKARPS